MKQILLISLIITSTLTAFAQSLSDKTDRVGQKLVLRIQPGDKLSGGRGLEGEENKSKILLGFKKEDAKDKQSLQHAQLKAGSGTGGWDHENPQSVGYHRQRIDYVNFIIRSYSLDKCQETEMAEALKGFVDAQVEIIDIDLSVDSEAQYKCLKNAIANLAN